jgi:hypothetical protein
MAAEVGGGMDSSFIIVSVLWIARTFPEVPLAVYKRGARPCAR